MRKKGKRKSVGIFIQLLIAMLLLTLLLSLGTAKLILSESVPQEKIGLCVCIYTALISFAVSLYSALRMPQKKFLWGLLTAVAYLCLLLLGNLLFFGIGYGNVLPGTLCVLCGGLLGSLLGAGKRKKYA